MKRKGLVVAQCIRLQVLNTLYGPPATNAQLLAAQRADLFVQFQLCSPGDVGKHLHSKLCTCHFYIKKRIFWVCLLCGTQSVVVAMSQVALFAQQLRRHAAYF